MKVANMLVSRPMCLFIACLIGFGLSGISNSACAVTTLAPLVLHVDATHVSQGLLHAELLIPVKPGPLTLDYPKWIPGEHGPTGSTANVAGLTFTANGQVLPWRRDLLEFFQIHLVVPKSATVLDVQFDYIDPIGSTGRNESDQETTPNMAMIAWNHFTFYPDGDLAQTAPVTTDITLPFNWQFATGLEVDSISGNRVQFKPASLYTTVDSPLFTGIYFDKIPLTAPGVTPPVELDIAADSPDDIIKDTDKLNAMKSLVVQQEGLFGSEHFRHYNFLVYLSDHLAEYGLEHSESNETGFPEDALTNTKSYVDNADTPAHEFFHSWNGKYRRPADLGTPEFIKPEQTDLLWVYEGLTQYYGFVLSARSGMLSQEQVREYWAAQLNSYDQELGRNWRSLQDSADDAPELYNAPNTWGNYRRGADFYDETSIDWLEADLIIRKETKGKKSLDDFCRLFYSQPTAQITAPVLKPYTETDVIAALNQVAPYDWLGYWNDRLNSLGERDLDQSYIDSGWNLTLNSTENDRGGYDEADEAGFYCAEDGSIFDIIPTSIAFSKGLAPGMRIIAINGYPFSRDVLISQFNAAKNSQNPIQLIVKDNNFYRVIPLDYHNGLQYPHLQRIPNTTDLLTSILSPIPQRPGAVSKSQ